MSSGVVSQRTRITSSPAFPRASAVSASRTISPEAAPGDALRPRAATSTSTLGSSIGWRSWSSCPASIRATASSREISPSAAISTAIRSAAAGGALAGARLQQVELPLLDRELDVLHVAVVRLEPVERRRQLGVRLGHLLLHRGDRLGRADPRDDVLALRVDEVLAVEDGLSRRRVAREAHARPGALALVAEDHLDDVHGRADVVGDLVGAPVDLGARRVPRVEDRPVGAAQLLPRVLREARADLLLVDALERGDQLLQVVGAEVDVVRHPAGGLEVGERALEPVRVDAVDDLAVHLDQPTVGVVGEARVAGRGRLALDGDVVQAEVEDRVHHPGHRDLRARAHRDEQRVGGVAEALARPLLERSDVLADLLVEALGHLLRRRHVGAARVGRDREAGRHRHPERGHLGEPDALAAEQLAASGRLLVEVVDVAHRRDPRTSVRARMADMAGHILAIGGGGFLGGDLSSPLDDLLLELAGKPRPHVVFLPTATGDCDWAVERFEDVLESARLHARRRLRPSASPTGPAERVAAADVVSSPAATPRTCSRSGASTASTGRCATCGSAAPRSAASRRGRTAGSRPA